MEKELYDYIMSKLAELATYSIYYPEEKIKEVYGSLLESCDSLDEMKKRVDDMFKSVLLEKQQAALNEKAKEGEYSNFDKIKEVANIIAASPIAPFVTIYGGSVPYLITGETPQRVIGDIDLSASIENMPQIRAYIKSHPETFKVIVDTTDYTDDYGLELKINGVNVSLFTHEFTPEGRIVRNFEYKQSTNSIDVKATLFPGIFDEDTTIQSGFNGHTLNFECPEYIYIQKSVALREKDRIDLEVLKKIVDEKKIDFLKKKSSMPKVIFSESVKMNKVNNKEAEIQ